MSAAWPTKALAEVCEIKPPKGEAKRKLKETDFVSFVPMEDLGIDHKFLEPKAERKLGDVAGSYTYFADRDVLLAKITPCFENGKLGIARGLKNGIGFGSSEYIVFRTSEELNNEYLYYFLLQDSFRADGIRTMSGAVGHKRVSKEFVERCQIPVPPLPEQQRIVAILDEAFAGLATANANAEKNLKSARELFDSYLNTAFEKKGEGLRTRPLEELCESGRVITYGVIKLGREISDGVPCLRTSNVRWLRIDTDGVKRISSVLSNEFRRTILRGGEVLVNVRGTLGGVAVAARDMKGWNVSREVAVVPVDPSHIEPEYLAYFIATRASQNWLTDVQKGVAYVGINIADLRTLPISFPDRKMQIRLIEQLQSLSAEARGLETTYNKRLSQIAELRQAILRAAFSGELTSPPSQAIQEAAE